MPDFRAQTCCFTGHRNIDPGDEQKIITRVKYILQDLMAKGVVYFCVGGAIGFDMIVAEYLIDLRDRQGKKIKIISVIPWPGWMEKWNDEQRRRQDRILKKSDKVVYVNQEYVKDVYLIRDRHLVDGSGYCVSYCTRRSGGTAYTVRYAFKQGLEVQNASSWDIRQLKK